jgi:DNA-binding MarR family transcriptional regulator
MNEPSPTRLNDHLCFAIYSANMAINRAYLPALEALGITYPQYLVLSALAEGDEHTIGSIAERLSLESSTVTPLVKRLEKAGLVARGRNPSDERQVFVTLLPRGAEVHAESKVLNDTLLARLRMRPDEASGLAAAMRGLGKRVSRQGRFSLKAHSDHV